MPNGFRGNAALSYLSEIDNALEVATISHNQNPLSGLPSNPLQPLPVLPAKRNVRNPNPPDTSHSGGHSTGFDSSANIVTDQGDYDTILRTIREIDRDMEDHIRRIATDAQALCDIAYRIPLTTPRCARILTTIQGSLASFTAPTETIVARIQAFANEINTTS